MVVGDFNEAMWQYEHFSSTLRGERQMEAFCNILDFCILQNMGFAGSHGCTITRNRGNTILKVRLDRGVATTNWMDRFPYATVTHLASPSSDHCPLLVSVVQESPPARRERQCYYEIMWEREASLDDCVVEAWEREQTRGDYLGTGTIHAALKGVMRSLKQWSKEKFGSVRKKLEEMRVRLATLQATDEVGPELREAIREMNEVLYREEMLWLQRSRISWLKGVLLGGREETGFRGLGARMGVVR